MANPSSIPPDKEHRVLRFRPRGKLAGPPFPLPGQPGNQGGDPVEGLAKFEGGEADDDYRHRMLVNVVAFSFTLLLIGGGIWIVSTLADIRKNQDCYLSGQRRCT